MRGRRLPILLTTALLALGVSGSAVAFDCIRVSSSLKGLTESTRSGNWLLFDFSSASGVQRTFADIFGVDLSSQDAACFATEYGKSRAPRYFALGIGVAGRNGVLAWHNPNTGVLGNSRGIDHIEDSAVIPAADAAGAACGIAIPDGEE